MNNKLSSVSNSSAGPAENLSAYEQELAQWIPTEFSSADFGDSRLYKRFLKIIKLFSSSPASSIPQATLLWKDTKGTYRFLNNDKVTPDNILQPHQQSTASRIAEQKVVLCVQDTTTLNYTHLPETEGLGTIGTDPDLRGLLVHTTLAITPEKIPLGIINQQTLIRPPDEYGKKHERKQKEIEEKESIKWFVSLAATEQLQKKFPDCILINTGDREADIYELFHQSSQGKCDLLIRAAQDRRVEHPEKYLWSYLENQPLRATLTVVVPRKLKKKERSATVELRFATVTLKPPVNKSNLPNISLSAIYLEEINPPKNEEPLSWLLLTTLPINSTEDAILYTNYYSVRFSIEIFHKILKSGCKIEEHQLKTAEGLKCCLAIDSIVAWRIMLLTLLGRALPDLPCTAVLEDYEWKALYCFIYETHTPPSTPLSLKEATRMIAQLGGFLARKKDGHPGVITIWRGMKKLSIISAAWKSFGPKTN